MKQITPFLYAVFAISITSEAMAHDGSHPDTVAPPVRAASHAPIGVMGDHMHKTGEWMVSYRYMQGGMEGLREGNDGRDPVQALQTGGNNYRILPTSMTMKMHMWGAMYAPTDTVTLTLMGAYLDKEMSHTTYAGMAGSAIGGEFTTHSRGWGDLKVGALTHLWKEGEHALHANMTLSIPTGSITEQDTVLMPNGQQASRRMPYGMQLGSGTWDPTIGATYNGRSDAWSWGAQYLATLRPGRNDEGYNLGNRHAVTAWSAYSFEPGLSLSARLAAHTQQQISGADRQIAGPVPTADPRNYGGEQADVFLGANIAGQSGLLRNHRLGVEVGLPVYRNLNGLQLERDWSVTIGYQYSF
ncbi:MAG: transporter [Alphaproteobacteria bacterium]|nr:transporter [Alphaproteobacteria bacterium]MBO6627764.1 transporter [Alphaproteobacteria bacterium]MDF1627546.1 hypothetical protein [Parvibaculaceae bacterium]